jgi:hypothetical protein
MMMGVVLVLMALVAVRMGFPADSDLTPGLRAVTNVVKWVLTAILIGVTVLVLFGLLLLGLCLASARK